MVLIVLLLPFRISLILLAFRLTRPFSLSSFCASGEAICQSMLCLLVNVSFSFSLVIITSIYLIISFFFISSNYIILVLIMGFCMCILLSLCKSFV